MTLGPAQVHHRTLALVRHYRNADTRAVGALLDQFTEPGDATAAITSLVQLLSWALDDHPIDAEEWLDSISLILAQTDTTR